MGTRGDVHWHPAIAIRGTEDAFAILLNQRFDGINVPIAGGHVRWKQLLALTFHFDPIDANGRPRHEKTKAKTLRLRLRGRTRSASLVRENNYAETEN